MMVTKEDLEKLTVLQLKEKLKSRKLLLSGTKPDLVSRLYESIVAEEKLLGNLDVESESASPSEFDLANVDVDEVLGIDSEIFAPSSEPERRKIELVSTIGSVSSVKQHLPKNPANITPVKLPSSPVKAAISVTKTSTSANTSSPIKKLDIVATESNESIAVDQVIRMLLANKGSEFKKSGLSTEDGQKMLQISKRLGLPCKLSSPPTKDILAKRAERFGPISNEVGKKQQRLERFGLSVSPAVDDKLAKRLQRFGAITDDAPQKKARTESPGIKPTGNDEELEKLRKRAERFGAVANKA